MKLNAPSGNMYPYAFTTNPLGGECIHKCGYCYRNKITNRSSGLIKKYSGEPRVIEHELSGPIKQIPEDKLVFVCSMTDLFAENVPDDSIERILDYCSHHSYNKYLFQTKNPRRFAGFQKRELFPYDCIFGVTLETNREYADTLAPHPLMRAMDMFSLSDVDTMVSVEPVMDFDLIPFVSMIKSIGNLSFVSIGADSGNNNLPEPSREKLDALINELSIFTEVRVKKNLEPLLEV